MLRSLFPKRGLHVERVSGSDAFGVACTAIARFHRHHDPPVGWMWGLFAWRILEVTRGCTFTRRRYGAASALYTAASQYAGASPIITYTMEHESGESLIAAGWHDEGRAGGGKWNRGCQTPDHLAGPKRRWCDRKR